MSTITATYFNLLKVYLFETWPAFIQLAILYLIKILSVQYVRKEHREEHTFTACRCFRIACPTLFLSHPGRVYLDRWGKQEVWTETLSLDHSCIERTHSQTEDQSKVLLEYCFTTSFDQSKTQGVPKLAIQSCPQLPAITPGRLPPLHLAAVISRPWDKPDQATDQTTHCLVFTVTKHVRLSPAVQWCQC